MVKRTKKNQEKDYLEQLEEWQENQYNPGHYTGGNTLPGLTPNTYSRKMGWLLIINALIFGIPSMAVIGYGFYESGDIKGCFIVGVTYGCLLFLYLKAGFHILSKTKHQKKGFHQLMRLLFNIIKAIFAIIAMICIVFIITGNVKEMTISDNYKYDYPHYYFMEDHTDHGIRYGIVVNINGDRLHLKLTEEKGEFIKASNSDGDLVIRIKYFYNRFTPDKGFVLYVEKVEDQESRDSN